MPRLPASPPTTFFLQGPGASQDAVFVVVSPKHVRVTAEAQPWSEFIFGSLSELPERVRCR